MPTSDVDAWWMRGATAPLYSLCTPLYLTNSSRCSSVCLPFALSPSSSPALDVFKCVSSYSVPRRPHMLSNLCVVSASGLMFHFLVCIYVCVCSNLCIFISSSCIFVALDWFSAIIYTFNTNTCHQMRGLMIQTYRYFLGWKPDSRYNVFTTKPGEFYGVLVSNRVNRHNVFTRNRANFYGVLVSNRDSRHNFFCSNRTNFKLYAS